MGSVAKPPVEGLPEGAEWVRIGPAKDTDFYILNELDQNGRTVTGIFQGPRANLPPGGVMVIVRPAPGYQFRADIRTLGYFPVKAIEPAETLTATVTFSVTNTYDRDAIKAQLEKMRMLPGFVSLSD